MDGSSWISRLSVCGVLALAAVSTGCQSDFGGQTLPSPWYLQDDVQYFPAGPEFKLSREAAAMESQQRGAVLRGAPPMMPSPTAIPVVPGPMPGAVPAPAVGGEAVPPPAAMQQ